MWFKPKRPVDAEEWEWLLAGFKWLAREFPDLNARRGLALPTPEFFPPSSTKGFERGEEIMGQVKKLAGLGFSVAVESGLGFGARIPDDDYRAAGASVVADAHTVVADADVVVRVRKPMDGDLDQLKNGVVHVSFLDPFNEKPLVANMAAKGISGLL